MGTLAGENYRESMCLRKDWKQSRMRQSCRHAAVSPPPHLSLADYELTLKIVAHGIMVFRMPWYYNHSACSVHWQSNVDMRSILGVKWMIREISPYHDPKEVKSAMS